VSVIKSSTYHIFIQYRRKGVKKKRGKEVVMASLRDRES